MLGIIGGSGFYQIEGLQLQEALDIETPFGRPSSKISVGVFNGQKIAFLARHGFDHTITPSEINFRANIWGLKSVGVREILSVSAVGSLQSHIRPGDLALPNQYLDWTRGKREGTFFGNGIVAHISTANPVCQLMSSRILDSARSLNFEVHAKKTYACVEGPRLGTRSESHFLKSNGADIVGMTNVPEAFLAREAQLCYATIAVVTDYDCWLEDPSEHATAAKVMDLYRKNIAKVQSLVGVMTKLGQKPLVCECRSSLAFAVMTKESEIGPKQKHILNFLRE